MDKRPCVPYLAHEGLDFPFRHADFDLIDIFLCSRTMGMMLRYRFWTDQVHEP